MPSLVGRGLRTGWNRLSAVGTDIADLTLARACAGCDEPGPVLCPHCSALVRQPVRAIAIGEDRTVLAALRYGGTARRILLDYKERGTHSLAPALGSALADAVRDCLDPAHEHVGITQIPAHRAALRRRGGDPLAALVRECVRTLRSEGISARAMPLLRNHLERPAAKSLGRVERARAMSGAFTCLDPGALPIVVVDDVVTTGTTLHEALDALESAHALVIGAAAVAATPLAVRS